MFTYRHTHEEAMMGKVVLVAKDFGPGAALFALVNTLRDRGVEVAEFFAAGKTPDFSAEDVLESCAGADWLVSGMGHSPKVSAIELAVLDSVPRDIRCALYADTFDCAGRKWFASVRERINLLFVVTDAEAQKARGIFPNARIIVSGNPLWHKAAFPTETRESVRKKFGFVDDACVVFVPGRKELHINMPHFNSAIAVAEMFRDKGRDVRLAISLHPGAPREDLDMYRGMLEGRTYVSLVSGKATDLLLGMDAVFNAASGAGIEAIYQRKPVVEFLPPVVLDEVERLHGRRVWQPVEDGVAVDVKSTEDAALAIAGALEYPDARLDLMEKHYPIPRNPEEAVCVMAGTLLQ